MNSIHATSILFVLTRVVCTLGCKLFLSNVSSLVLVTFLKVNKMWPGNPSDFVIFKEC